jgi:stage II sporulation protein D
MIQGKVLQSGKDFIEIEGYGKVPLEEDYRIYKIYGEISMEPTGSILVGYENTDFIVSGGKISAALITESIKAENIRVLLETSNFKGVFHEKVEFTASSDFIISSKDSETSYTAGDIVSVEPGDDILADGRIIIETTSDDAKIEILSIERSDGIPKYRGRIEIAEGDNGLLVVNELPLEEYLYAVIPSEMPTYYGLEALKVQAVCARSYAYKHLLANSLSQYGAHVDDSVSYQVYNNISENEDSILAVKDTYGKIIKYDGDVITAYYFSTSCGHTAKAASVWASNIELPYLEGKLMLVEEDGEGAEEQSKLADQYEDLSSEENFRSFIETEEVPTYDSEFNWYRWKVTMKLKEIKQVIDQILANRYNANPELILTMTNKAEDGEEAVYESIPVNTVGNIVDISVLKRESGGIISELLITGSENTIKVRTEYNIRALLAPLYDTVIRQDDSEVENLSLLPSAFFTINKNEKDGELNSITLTGGGYGHGVGMSQNGVKALADSGKKYEDIVEYFYEGTEIGFIYE